MHGCCLWFLCREEDEEETPVTDSASDDDDDDNLSMRRYFSAGSRVTDVLCSSDSQFDPVTSAEEELDDFL